MSDPASARPGLTAPGLWPCYPIRTGRLDLRPHRETDLDDLLAFHSSPAVTRFIPWPVRDRDEVRAALEVKLTQGALTEPGQWLVLAAELRDTGHVVGEVLLKWASAEHRQGELGYAFAEHVWGRGLAPEAAAAVLTLAFEELALHRVSAQLVAANVGSARVVAKLGMRHEASVEDAWLDGDRWLGEQVWAITAPEWRALRG